MFQLNDTGSIPQVGVNTNTAAGGDCVVQLNAVADNYHVIDWISFNYRDTPTANATLVVLDNTLNTTLYVATVTAAGPGQLVFPPAGLPAGKSSEVLVTLLDGTQIKDLSVGYR